MGGEPEPSKREKAYNYEKRREKKYPRGYPLKLGEEIIPSGGKVGIPNWEGDNLKCGTKEES